MKTQRLIFADGSIGYTSGPDNVEQSVVIHGNPEVGREDISVRDEKHLIKLIDKSQNKRAKLEKGKPKKDKEGRFIVEDL